MYKLICFSIRYRESIQNCSDIRIDPSFDTAELFAYLTHPCIYDKQTSPLHGFNEYKIDLINTRLHVYYLKYKPANNLVSTKCFICFLMLETLIFHLSQLYVCLKNDRINEFANQQVL